MNRLSITVALLSAVWSAFAQAPPSAAASSNSVNASASAASASAPPPSAPSRLSAAELEKLAMPIALHPDPLISIILPASAYPVEIVQAARFVRDTNNIAKLDEQSWDENVKAVAKFPEMIAKMDADLAWTVSLGKAFIDQPKELMDTIQALRSKAVKAGTLQSTSQQKVAVTNVVIVQTNVTQVVNVTNQIVQVQPSDPQVIYEPSYPTTVYYPPPAYVYDPWAPLVSFGVGITVGAIIANNCDWHHGGVYVGHHGFVAWGGSHHGDVDIDIDEVNINRDNVNVNRENRGSRDASNRSAGAQTTQQKWQPDQNRLSTSGAAGTANREARGWGTPSAQPATRQASAAGTRPTASTAPRAPQQSTYNWSQRPAAPSQPTRSPGVTGGQRTTTPQQPSANRLPVGSGTLGSRPAQQSYNRPTSSPSTAFGGASGGSFDRSAGMRGATSRGGGGGGMRGGGGRR